MSKSATSGRAVTALERIATQASRIEAIANIVGDFLGHESDLYQRLEQEVRVSKSIFNQVQEEATTKVEETAMPKNYDNGTDGTAPPAEVQAVIDAIMASLKAQGIDASVEVMVIPRGPTTPMSIFDILKKL